LEQIQPILLPLCITAFFVVIGLLVTIIILLRKLGTEKSKNASFEGRMGEIRMRMQALEVESIKHKLNPHLFKNVLNSIQSHAYQTYHALEKLSEVLDYILYESEESMVSVQKEVSFARNLIEINRLKLSPLFDLRVLMNVDENDTLTREALIAPLISAPLIENAFKHADIQSEDAFIAVKFEFNNGLLAMHVANSVSERPPLRKTNSGIGDTGLQKRLEAVYGRFYQLEKGVKDRTYQVSLKIDLNGYKNQMCVGG
jgi:LytS/YehU family sensor histidine kinase